MIAAIFILAQFDVALLPGGRWAVTVDRTANSIRLVDLEAGTLAAEAAVGKRPTSVAVSADGSRAVVTGWLDDSLTLLKIAPPAVEVVVTFPVGDEPRGVVMSPDGRTAYVSLSGENAVVAVDWEKRAVVARAAVSQEPWYPALTADGRRLVVAGAIGREVNVLETPALTPLLTASLRGVNPRRPAISPDGAWIYIPYVNDGRFPTTAGNIGLGWVVSNRLARVSLTEEAPRGSVVLDPRGRGAADLEAVAVSPDGATLAVAAGGTHELLLLKMPLPFESFASSDLMDRRTRDRLRRVELGGRPTAVVFTADGSRVVVANDLADALQVVTIDSGEVRTIALGGPAEPSLARRGEVIFHDASRSFEQWFSCHSCHTEGHTNGALYDTLNDGGFGMAKKTPSLRGVTKTAPWTWHGWQTDLRAAAKKSLTETMRGPAPSEADLDALMAYLETLDFAPPRGPVPARGEALFRTRGCTECHSGPLLTDAKVHEVGLEVPEDKYRGYNAPSLKGVGNRGPWLHDGRAATLEEVLGKHHRPEKELTAEEMKDLIDFLRAQ